MTTKLLSYLEHSAARLPDKIAFDDGNERVSFAQLRWLAQEVGSFLVRRVTHTACPIAVITRHRVADIVAFFGVLYAACFYVPVDGEAEKAFIQSRLDAVEPAFVIDAPTLADLPRSELDNIALEAVSATQRDADTACAVFTSGSTGIPKCALTSHRAITDLAEWHTKSFDHSEHSIYGNQTPFFFIASVKEIYLTVKNGATTHILPKELFARPAELLQRLDALRVNTIMWATAAVKLIATLDALASYAPQGLKSVFFSGENMPASAVNYWKGFLPRVRYVNLYGLTETATNVAHYTVDRPLDDGESVPIGKPRQNVTLLLLNDGVLAKDGETGEICVGGACLSAGYWKNPQMTARLFTQNPLQNAYPETLYRTGDIARYNAAGELVYVCRKDSQVKHMGVRVELGEVETFAAGIEKITATACAYDTAKSRIVLFYAGDVAPALVRAALRGGLPKYLLPNRVVRLEKLPFLPNGKADRVKLNEMILQGDE